MAADRHHRLPLVPEGWVLVDERRFGPFVTGAWKKNVTEMIFSVLRVLGLVLGAYLVGYMSYFVGCFAAAAGEPVAGALVAWVPWSVVRVAAFVLLGVLAARPVLLHQRWPFGPRDLRWAVVAAFGLMVDVTMKIALAGEYGRYLRGWLPT